MRSLSTATSARAINDDDSSDEEKNSYDSSDERSRGWFGDLARPLLGDTDPGPVFHALTGIEPRQGQRYGYGETKAVPLYFGVQLLRSEQGEQWLNAYMDGCKVAWWLRHQRADERANKSEAMLAATKRQLTNLLHVIESGGLHGQT